jgi:hypothetical protein
MTETNYKKPRKAIPAELRRSVEVESGHCCAIKGCNEHTYLEIHHIDKNRDNNTIGNLILLCDKHHKMAHADVIDRKALREYKRLLTGSTELSSASLDSLLRQVFGNETAAQLLCMPQYSIPVILNSATVAELEPYMAEGWISLQPTGSVCSMGAGNRVGNHVEERKRPYGLGSGFVLSCHYKG